MRAQPTLGSLQHQLNVLAPLVADLQGQLGQVPTVARDEARGVVEGQRAELQALLLEARLALRALVDATERARAEGVVFAQADLNAAVGRG